MRKENYTFSKQEIEILKQIANGNNALTQIREKLSMTPSLLSHYLKKLEGKYLIKTQHESSFDRSISSSRKSIVFQNTKHSLILKELLTRYSHIKWESVLRGSGIDVLFQILNDSTNIKENISAVTFWRYSRNFMALGIIVDTYEKLQINERFSLLKDFLIEYQKFIINSITSSITDKVTMLWQKDFECLIRVPKTTQVTEKGFTKTATSRFQDFGIQLTSDFDVYFYSKRRTAIILEDVILHTLLIEKRNVRYVTYSLLLLKKEQKRVNKEYLLTEATWYDLNLEVTAMLEFLRTRGTRTGTEFPTWNEFANKLKEYQMETVA